MDSLHTIIQSNLKFEIKFIQLEKKFNNNIYIYILLLKKLK